jgi:hypothetical protein
MTEGTDTGHVEPPYVVVCCVVDDGTYDSFVHEADMMMGALGLKVDAGEITADEAWEELRPYEIVLAEEIEAAKDDDIEGFFPHALEEYDYFPGTRDFAAAVERLALPGVELNWDLGFGAVGENERIMVRDTAALEALSERLKDTYRIVPLSQDDWDYWTEGVEQARETIARARAGSVP